MRLRRVAMLGCAAYLLECLNPTEFTIVITTDVPCSQLQGVSISVGTLGAGLESAAPSAVAQCTTEGTIGSIVLVPTASRDASLGVRVVAGFNGPVETCVPPYGPRCVVARRSVRYVEHTALSLPIRLTASCAGLACEPSDTCYDGRCVPAAVDPSHCSGAECPPTVPRWTDCGDPTATAAGAAWPMTFGCPQHTRASPFAAATQPKFRWKYPTGTGLEAYPQIDGNGDVWLGQPDGNVVCVDGKTGRAKRIVPVNTSNIQGNGALTPDGHFLISTTAGATGGTLSILTADGGVEWRSDTQPGADMVVGAGGVVFFQTDKDLIGVSALAYDKLYSAPGFAHAGGLAPAIASDGWVYVLTPISQTNPSPLRLVALDSVANQKWTLDLNQPNASLVTIHGDTLYVAAPPAQNSTLFTLDRHSGASLRAPVTAYVNAARAHMTVGHDGTAYISQGTALVALDGATGAQRWAVELGGPCSLPILDASGAVIVYMDLTHEIAAVDLSTRSVRWRVDAAEKSAFNELPGDMLLSNEGSLILASTSGIWSVGY